MYSLSKTAVDELHAALAHLVLQTKTRVLNGEMEDVFRRRWPASEPSPQTKTAAENCSSARPPWAAGCPRF